MSGSWRVVLTGMLAAAVVGMACTQGSEVQELQSEREGPGPEPSPGPLTPQVFIDQMDNARQLLQGHVQSRTGVLIVSVYENDAWLGDAPVDAGGHWSLPWQPRETSESLEVRVHDVLEQAVSQRLVLQHLNWGESASRLEGNALLLSFAAAATGTDLRYTLDGSTPTPASPAISGPLVLLGTAPTAPLALIPTNPPDSPGEWRWQPPKALGPAATVLRLRVFAGSLPVSPGQVQTFLPHARASSLPVLSLVTDAGNFFDFVRGIYVPGKVHEDQPEWNWYWGTGNYMQDGNDWERPVHVEWFDDSGARVLSQDAGVRIHGGGSAALPQKSLRLYAKDDYGPDTFAAALFPRSSLTEYKRLVVRTSGQDSLSSKLKDCALQGVLRDTALDLQDCRPAVVYLDGEYWGLHELRERYDEYYLSAHHGLDRKQVVILNGDGSLDVGVTGDEAPFTRLLAFVREHDLSDASAYAQVKAWMDVDNFIEYTIAELYFGNQDWPQNNTKLWRYRTGSGTGPASMNDGRWRWLLYDLDYAFFAEPDFDPLLRVLQNETLDSASPALLLRGLLQSPEFKARFVERFLWHIDNTFTPERVSARIQEVAEVIAPEMPTHVDRWGYPASVEQWRAEVQGLHDWAAQRPDFMRQFLHDALGAP